MIGPSAQSSHILPRAPLSSNPTLKCPFQVQEVRIEDGYYLDVGEAATFTMSLISTMPDASVSMLMTNAELVDSNKVVTRDEIMDASAIKTQVRLNVTMRPRSYTKEGKTDIRIIPSDSNIACPQALKVICIA